MKRKATTILLALAAFAAPIIAEGQSRHGNSGSIRHRPPSHPDRPVTLPSYGPSHRPGSSAAADAYIRREIRKEVRREIRQERRERALFLGGLAVLGAVTRSLPPRHTTVIVQGRNYYYAEGTWYGSYGGEYRCIPPPIGAVVTVIPADAYIVVWGGARYYYYNGAYYSQGPGGYSIVAPPPGVIVPGLPQGYEQRGGDYVYGGVAYREVLGADGEPGYQVIGQ